MLLHLDGLRSSLTCHIPALSRARNTSLTLGRCQVTLSHHTDPSCANFMKTPSSRPDLIPDDLFDLHDHTRCQTLLACSDPTSMIIQAIKSTCSQQRWRNRFPGTKAAHLTIISENMYHNIPCNLGETLNSTSWTLTTNKPSSVSSKCCQIFITTWRWHPHGLSISLLMNMLTTYIKIQIEGFKRKEVCEETNLV